MATDTRLGKAIGAAIRLARQGADLTQADLARAVGREQSTVAKWEGGVADTMQLGHLVMIEETCRVRPGWILERAGYSKPATSPEELIAADSRIPARLANAMLVVYRFVVLSTAVHPTVEEPSDPDEIEIWKLESLPEAERWKLIAHLRAIKAERGARVEEVAEVVEIEPA